VDEERHRRIHGRQIAPGSQREGEGVTAPGSPPPGTISGLIADYVLGLRLDDVSGEVRRFAKLMLLDCLGCMIVGAQTPSGRAALALARESPLPQARLAGNGERAGVERAALANTVCANALDFEAVGPEGHIGVIAVPVVLALADWHEHSGAAALAALIAGLDVGGRIGAAWRRNTSGTAVVGLPPVRGAPHAIFAATVPAAMLLGLDREAIRNALGIASYSAHVPTLRKVLESYDPPMTKYDHMGGMALGGLDAVRLAMHGFTGDREAFEGEYGAWRYSGALGCDWSMLAEFGGDFMIAPTFFKPVPCNLYDCSVVVLVQKIVAEHHIRPADITRMILRPSRDIKGHGGDGSGGSMSQWLSVRLNAAHGACGTRPYSAWQNGEPPPAEVARLVAISTIEPYVETGPPDEKYWEGHVPTSVTIETANGTYDDRMPYLKRMSAEELVAKFVENVAPGAGETRARELADMVLRFDELPRASMLLDRLYG
jgi:hypothetical protein